MIDIPGKTLAIALVIESAGGGTGRHVLDLAEGLLKLDHRVVLFFSSLRLEDAFERRLHKIDGLETVIIDIPERISLMDLHSSYQLHRLLRQWGPFDIVHAHSSKAGGVLRLSRKRAPFGVVYTPHAVRTMDPTLSAGSRYIFGAIERWLAINRTDAVIAVSNAEYGECRRIGIPERLMHLSANGIAAPQLKSRRAVREELGLSVDDIVIGFVGRLTPQKAPERLLHGFAAQARNDIQLVLLADTEAPPHYRQLLEQLGIEHNTHLFVGRDGQQTMPAFDLLVMPSRYESMGYVLIEAVAAGVPVVATRVGAAEEFVEEGINGLLLPNIDDPATWSACLNLVLEPARLSALQQSANAKRDFHNVDDMVQITADLYAKTAAGRARAIDLPDACERDSRAA